MTNPFDAAINHLTNRMNSRGEGNEKNELGQAIRVLKAAGKVDESALETFMEMVCKPRDIWEEARVAEIRALLAALPDKPGKETP